MILFACSVSLWASEPDVFSTMRNYLYFPACQSSLHADNWDTSMGSKNGVLNFFRLNSTSHFMGEHSSCNCWVPFPSLILRALTMNSHPVFLQNLFSLLVTGNCYPPYFVGPIVHLIVLFNDPWLKEETTFEKKLYFRLDHFTGLFFTVWPCRELHNWR